MNLELDKWEKIKVDRSEALRYLGYKGTDIDEETSKTLDESIVELMEISQFNYVYRIFPLNKNGDNIIFENSLINIVSKDLSKLFESSEKTAVMAATLGLEVEKRIRYYSLTNLSKAVVFDACAASLIESLCDYVESEIKEIANKEGLSITYRYSPGYGDVPISHQGEIVKSLDAQKLIGLTVSNSSILIPRKSVTAFIGFSKKEIISEKSCLNCNLYGNCKFSKEGVASCVK